MDIPGSQSQSSVLSNTAASPFKMVAPATTTSGTCSSSSLHQQNDSSDDVTITKDLYDVVRAAIPSRQKIMMSVAARVYTALCSEENCQSDWTLIGEGALTMTKQSFEGTNQHIFRFHLVDLTSSSILWSQECHLDFEYQRLKRDFYIFFMQDHAVVGFQFSNRTEARDFNEKIMNKICRSSTSGDETFSKKKKKRRGFFARLFGSSSDTQASSSSNSKSTSSSTRSATSCSHDNSNVNTVSSNTGSEGTHRSQHGKEITEDDVGDPYDFEHLSHIGFNVDTGKFDVKNIPKEWQDVFRKAGISDRQLGNKDTAQFIAQFVSRNPEASGVAGKSKDRRRPPPPPPPKKKTKNSISTQSTHAQQDPPLPSSKQHHILPPELEHDKKRMDLMASIRDTGGNKNVLKPVEDRSVNSPSSSPTTTTNSSGNNNNSSPMDQDMMAGMLAKALAARNRRLAHSDSD